MIIHFQPIELYPPIQNLIRILEMEFSGLVTVISTKSVKKFSPFQSFSENIQMKRIARSGHGLLPLARYLNYCVFYAGALFTLLQLRPKRIMYFETISSLPAYLYKIFFYKNVELFIHYHEYTSPTEYDSGMLLNRYFHRLEKHLYPRATLVSHTNQFRMDMFKEDILPSTITNPQIIPNYPPVKWKTLPKPTHSPLRIVYVGSLSLTTMYVEAFANWVVGKQGEVVWDIYSYNYTAAAEKLIDALNCPWIRLCPAVEYDQLPEILRKYDVGVILYTGHIPNYVYNAPNKLFEYLACGLDVWFPKVMVGSLQYVRDKMLPKVLAFEFDNLANINLITAMDRQYVISNNTFFCEDVLLPLINKLTSHD